MEDIKLKAKLTKSDPRTIIRDCNKDTSDAGIVKLRSQDSLRQTIGRIRSKAIGACTVSSINDIKVPDELQFTYKKEKFYWDDSGEDDENRVIIFTTQ